MDAKRLCETTLKLPQTESEVCEWLQRQNLLRRCPLDDRLDRAGQAKWLNRLTEELGARYVACTLTNFDTAGSPAKAAAVERLQRFAESMPDHLRGGGGLMLYGNPGTGKDHLVAALLKIAIAGHRLSAKWVDGGRLFDMIAEAATSDDPRGIRKLQADLIEPHILAISDPQPPKGDLSPTHVRRIRDIIDRRYRDGKSTWLTTNLATRDNAEALLTKPVMDRLRDASGVIDCSWPSYRQARKATW